MAFPLALLATVLLALGAWRDIATRTIPDMVGLLLLAIGGCARLLQGPLALTSSLGASFILFSMLMIAYSRQLIGGGDVKVMTAFCVGLSPLASYHFVVATAIAGGLLGLLYLLLSRMPDFVCRTKSRSLLGRVLAIEAWRIRRRGPLPYGVAIAAGGAFVVFSSGSL
jgi:prepilin peptidase CpaA